MKPRLKCGPLRKDLGLSQVEFGQLFGVHFMTVSKWERELLLPSSYQLALMRQFASAVVVNRFIGRNVRAALAETGVVSALRILLEPQ